MNNQEIIANLIAKIDQKSNVKNNIFDKFFNQGVADSDIIYPSLRYRNVDEDTFSHNINLPITQLKEPSYIYEEKNTKVGDNYIVYDDIGNQILVSEKDFVSNDLHYYRDVAKATTNQDILDFQGIVNTIVKNAESYKEELKNINGAEFENLVTLLGEGYNLKNKLDLKYIPYEANKEKVVKEIDTKTIEKYLFRKRVNENSRNLLKKIISTKSNRSLYDVYNLSDENTLLYLDNIATMTLASKSSNKEWVAPKTDIIVTFFTINKELPIQEAFNNRKIYKDETLNISVKQDSFIGFHSVSVDLNHRDKNQQSLYSELHRLITSATSNQMIAERISKDCIRTINKNKDFDNLISNISQIKVFITPNKINFNSSYGGGLHSVMYKSKFKLGHFDRSKSKKDTFKFLYGNFTDSYGNSNAMLHVKNKSDIFNINNLIKNLEPISLWNDDLIKEIDKLNIFYLVAFYHRNMMNVMKKRINISYDLVKDKKIIVYSGRVNTNKTLSDYYFQGSKDVDTFSKELVSLVNAKSKIKLIIKDYYGELLTIIKEYGVNIPINKIIFEESSKNNKMMNTMFKKAYEIAKKDNKKQKNGGKNGYKKQNTRKNSKIVSTNNI